MALTYEPIATYTFTSNASNTTFSSIPQTYTDIVIQVFKQANFGTSTQWIQFNGDSGTNYSVTRLYGDGSSALSSSTTSSSSPNISGVSPGGSYNCYNAYNIFSYTGSTYKTFLAETNQDQSGTGTVTNTVGLWRSTSAITSITVSGGFNTGSMITLYGIKAA
jgi:hypothetical protein